MPPGQGLTKTRNRNRRRKEAKRLIQLKQLGVLPPHATFADLRGAGNESFTDLLEESNNESADLLEKRRQSLLEKIEAGGIDVSQEANVVGVPKSPSQPMIISKNASPANLGAQTAESNNTSEQNNATIEDSNNTTNGKSVPVESETPRRRAKLDVASSRRMLFGSLGLRTPKTLADEDKLRKKLMENVRPSAPIPTTAPLVIETEPEEDDSWRDKIVLKAVECCYDGIELSTPPFPFVQRWDPQQQGGSRRQKGGVKSKKRKRNQSQYYENNEDDGTFYTEDQHFAGDAENAEEECHEGTIRQSGFGETQSAINNHLPCDTQESLLTSTAMEDLPAVPADIEAYPALNEDLAQPGAIIVFKEIHMSAETNWSPLVSGYRTAIVVKSLGNGRLELTLAHRDRQTDDKEYDPETGDRVYQKFEMPDADDQQDDDGRIELNISEMIEPKLQSLAAGELAKVSGQSHHVDQKMVIEDNDDMHASSSAAPPEASEIHFEGVKGSHVDLSCSDPKSSAPMDTAKSPAPQEQDKVSDSTRQEISLLIKDAGLPSIVPGEVMGGLEEEAMEENIKSPVFSGFEADLNPNSLSTNELGESGEINPIDYPIDLSKLVEPVPASQEASCGNMAISSEEAVDPSADASDEEWQGMDGLDDVEPLYPDLLQSRDEVEKELDLSMSPVPPGDGGEHGASKRGGAKKGKSKKGRR